MSRENAEVVRRNYEAFMARDPEAAELRRASAERGSRMSPRSLAVVLLTILIVGSGCGSNGGDSSGTSGSSGGSSTDARPAALSPTGAKRRASLIGAAKRLVRTYYADIDSGDYRGAWDLLSPGLQSSLGGYDFYRVGAATTDRTSAISIAVSEVSRRAAVLSVTVESSVTDACGTNVEQRFAGTWWLGRRAHSWIATDMNMPMVSGDEPVANPDDCP